MDDVPTEGPGRPRPCPSIWPPTPCVSPGRGAALGEAAPRRGGADTRRAPTRRPGTRRRAGGVAVSEMIVPLHITVARSASISDMTFTREQTAWQWGVTPVGKGRCRSYRCLLPDPPVLSAHEEEGRGLGVV